MRRTHDRAGIDLFRPLAAVLVVAIHTQPLLDVSEDANFILVNILSRLAVPFFFMTSGYFTVTRYTKDMSRLLKFEKRAALWYLFSTLLYLPVIIRNGYFAGTGWLSELVRDIVFDGTFYHLWYLPAAMLGCAIAYQLVRRCDYPGALAIAGALYLAGFFGDTIVGINTVPPFNVLLQIMDRTRNGLFFAPLFFVLGGLCRDRREETNRLTTVVLFAVSLLLMAGETVALRGLRWGKNYAMTLSLPAVSAFLFSLIASFRGKRRRDLRTFALLVYIIHPLAILSVRAAARHFGMWEALVENNLLHFLAVCAVSFVVSGFASLIFRRFAPASPDPSRSRAWIELDMDALRNNLTELKKLLPPKGRLMAVVKREAYGHGAFEVAAELERMGVDAFATATIDEAIALRKYGLRGEILVLGHTDPLRSREAKRYRVTLTLTDLASARALDRQNVKLNTHLKLDTGMHRLGVPFDDAEAIGQIMALKNIAVTGVFTHLACSESREGSAAGFTALQTERFESAMKLISSFGKRPAVHIDSTYGLLNYPGFDGDYVRIGLGVYGIQSAPGERTVLAPRLCPVLSLKARVVSLREVPAGEGVGYGLEGVSDRDRVVALLPIGYGDGYPRALSNGVGHALIRGGRAKVVGFICMDMMLLDVTDLPGVAAGDTATLIGSEGGEMVGAETVAALAGTITNELVSRLGPRLPVTIKKGL